jgi:Ohr subfamily peroxiredoxin
MSIKSIYTAHATSIGGRGGGTAKTADGALDLKIGSPKEMGGKDEGVNPEQLFAVGYSSCYLGAMKYVAGKMTPPVKIADNASATAHVSFGPRDDGEGFGLEVAMDVNLPGIDKAVAEDIATKAHVVCPYSHATKGNIKVTTNIM